MPLFFALCIGLFFNLIATLIAIQDMWLYLSEHEYFNDFGAESALVWHETNIPYAVWGSESTRTLSTKYYPSEVTTPTSVNTNVRVYLIPIGFGVLDFYVHCVCTLFTVQARLIVAWITCFVFPVIRGYDKSIINQNKYLAHVFCGFYVI